LEEISSYIYGFYQHSRARESITFKEGDGILIIGGKENRHKGRIAEGE